MSTLRDDVDREHLREAVDSHGYAILTARVNATIEQQRNQLEQPAGEARTEFVRGQLAGLRLALKLPDMMFGEYEEARKQRKNR